MDIARGHTFSYNSIRESSVGWVKRAYQPVRKGLLKLKIVDPVDVQTERLIYHQRENKGVSCIYLYSCNLQWKYLSLPVDNNWNSAVYSRSTINVCPRAVPSQRSLL